MVIYVWRYADDTFTRIAAIDYATSVIWVQRFQAVGECELYIRASEELIDIFSGDIFLTRDDSEIAMYVETVDIKTDSENGDYLTITGRSAEVMLSWRIIQRAVYSASTTTAETIIRDLLRTWIVQPDSATLSDNYIPFLSLESAHGWSDKTTNQFTGKNLSEVIYDLCVTYDYGLRFAWTGSGFEIQLYKGTDRSYGQNENTFVVFSPEFDNLGNTEYQHSTANYANSAIIGGEGEGTERKFATVYPQGVTGFYRRTIYVDGRNTSSDTEGGTLTPAQYTAMLQAQGNDAIAEHKVIQTFSGEIISTNTYVYGRDYFLGDKISIENSYGVKGNATILEITEVEDETGYRLVPTLSEWDIENALMDSDGYIIKDSDNLIVTVKE